MLPTLATLGSASLGPCPHREPISEPIEQGRDGIGESIVRTMNGTRLPGLIEDQLLLGSRLVIGALRMPCRHEVVVLPVNDEKRAGDLVDHAIEGKRLQSLPGVREVLRSREPA